MRHYQYQQTNILQCRHRFQKPNAICKCPSPHHRQGFCPTRNKQQRRRTKEFQPNTRIQHKRNRHRLKHARGSQPRPNNDATLQRPIHNTLYQYRTNKQPIPNIHRKQTQKRQPKYAKLSRLIHKPQHKQSLPRRRQCQQHTRQLQP